MMKFLSHSDDRMGKAAVTYASTLTLPSLSMAGVEFTVLRLSLARRMGLARKVLELSRRMDFRDAGGSVEDKIEASVLGCEIDQVYIDWGLVGISGLTIDGVIATPELVSEKGPEGLAREIVDAIKAQCGLTENERKN
jgi:hypothetical protein